MKVYNFHPTSGEFISVSNADPDPLNDGEWLIPAFATTAEPPTYLSNETISFDGSDWVILADYRGIDYWTQDGNKHVISELGVELPEDALLEEPLPQQLPAQDSSIKMNVMNQQNSRCEVDIFIENASPETLIKAETLQAKINHLRSAANKIESDMFAMQAKRQIPELDTEVTLKDGLNVTELPVEELQAKDDFNTLRESAYREESDKFFLEAIRKEAIGDIEGAMVARKAGLAAVVDIKQRFSLNEII